MTPENALIRSMNLSTDLTEDQRLIFFQMLAAASIAYIRGSQGDAVLQGFIYAAINDNVSMTIDDIKETFN